MYSVIDGVPQLLSFLIIVINYPAVRWCLIPAAQAGFSTALINVFLTPARLQHSGAHAATRLFHASVDLP